MGSISFDVERFDRVAQLYDLVLGQVADLGVRVHPCLLEQIVSRRAADPEDVGEPDLQALLVREIDSSDACQVASPAFACVVGSCR